MQKIGNLTDMKAQNYTQSMKKHKQAWEDFRTKTSENSEMVWSKKFARIKSGMW